VSEISDERRELERTIMRTLKENKTKTKKLEKRIELAKAQIMDAEGAMIVPEQTTLIEDLHQIYSLLWDMSEDMEARMKDLENLLKVIEKERDDADKDATGENQE